MSFRITLLSLIIVCFTIAGGIIYSDSTSGFGSSYTSALTSVDSYRKNLLIEERFETSLSAANPNNKYHEAFPIWYNDFKVAAYKPYSFNVSSTVKKAGSTSARFEMRKADAAEVDRVEFMPTWQETNKNRWYGLSIYLPSANWATGKDWEILTQFWSQYDPGEGGHNPPVSLFVQNGRYVVKIRWDKDKFHVNGQEDGNKTYDLGPVEKDKWLDFVYHINWSYGSDGVVEVWKNGQKVVDHRGPNSYNDPGVPYFKFGIYKTNFIDGSISNRIAYIDEVRVGNENATYNDVAPTASSSTSAPAPTSPTTTTSPTTSGSIVKLINAGGAA